MFPISVLSCKSGWYWSNACTWSASPLNSISLQSHLINNSSRMTCNRVNMASVKTLRRYLVVRTRCNFRSLTDLPFETKSFFTTFSLLSATISVTYNNNSHKSEEVISTLLNYQYRMYPDTNQKLELNEWLRTCLMSISKLAGWIKVRLHRPFG